MRKADVDILETDFLRVENANLREQLAQMQLKLDQLQQLLSNGL